VTDPGQIPPLLTAGGLPKNRLRLFVVRGTIVVLFLAAILLLWRPWDALDDSLFRASDRGHIWIVRCYLLGGKDVNAQNPYGDTPLMAAAWNGRRDIADLLLRHGANLDLADRYGNTALMYAAMWGRDNVVAYLIGKGASLNRQDLEGNTAMISALRYDHVSTARLLLEAGANADLQNRDGETALTKAAQRGLGAMVSLLKHHGTINTDVTIGASRYPTKPLSAPRLWALATTALLVQYNNDSHELLGSRPSCDRAWARDSLSGWWEVNNRDEAIRMLDWLWTEGHRTRYQTEDRSWRKKSHVPIPYLAWDYCRLVWVAGVSYIAGYVTEEEAWQRILPAARAIQSNYSSWREMGEDYLRGRQRWNGKRDPQFDAILQLLVDPKNSSSPWNKNGWSTDLSEVVTNSLTVNP
jgi:hypothetical protein